MWARVTRFSIDAARVADVTNYVAETAIPAVRSLPGFVTGYWTLDESGARTLNVTIWETQEALRATESDVSELRRRAKQAGATLEGVDVFHVIRGSGPRDVSGG